MSKLTRRTFLKSTAAATAGYWLTANAISATRAADEPNGKLHFAAIGVQGKGSSDVDNCLPLGLVVALCDIDDKRLQRKSKQPAGGYKDRRGETPEPENTGPKPYAEAKLFNDYREMFEKMGDKIDAVTVSTPDHTHAPASIRAMKLGKHVYCQKPLTHTIGEARLMRQTAKQYKVCTQMGNQGSAENGLRRAVEIVQAGVLGQVTEAHIWTNRPWTYWKQAPDVVSRPESKPVPDHIHWDLWLGAAPERPFANGYHPMTWRGFWDFGTGALGDMACHTANMAYRALKLESPISAVAESGEINPETYPAYAHVTIQFPARGSMVPVTWNWYEGKKDGKKMLPPEDLIAKVLKDDQKLVDSGSILVGERGILYSPNDYGAEYFLFGDGVKEAAEKVERTLPRNNQGDFGMKKEWVQAIHENKPSLAYSNFDNAGMLAETVLIGNIAVKTGKKIEFDGEKCAITNDADANALINKQYRKGFEI